MSLEKPRVPLQNLVSLVCETLCHLQNLVFLAKSCVPLQNLVSLVCKTLCPLQTFVFFICYFFLLFFSRSRYFIFSSSHPRFASCVRYFFPCLLPSTGSPGGKGPTPSPLLWNRRVPALILRIASPTLELCSSTAIIPAFRSALKGWLFPA